MWRKHQQEQVLCGEWEDDPKASSIGIPDDDDDVVSSEPDPSEDPIIESPPELFDSLNLAESLPPALWQKYATKQAFDWQASYVPHVLAPESDRSQVRKQTIQGMLKLESENVKADLIRRREEIEETVGAQKKKDSQVPTQEEYAK